VYLSRNTANQAPASTVMTHRDSANIPLVVRTLDDAIRAAIELHDLPAPRPGCPIPPVGPDHLVRVGDVVYGTPQEAYEAICPPLDSPKRSARGHTAVSGAEPGGPTGANRLSEGALATLPHSGGAGPGYTLEECVTSRPTVCDRSHQISTTWCHCPCAPPCSRGLGGSARVAVVYCAE